MVGTHQADMDKEEGNKGRIEVSKSADDGGWMLDSFVYSLLVPDQK
jgi:hypothetical protein